MNDQEYEEWEEKVEEIKKNNAVLIDEFSRYLQSKSLKTKTINKHIDNIDFYVNYFLVYYDIIPAEDGATEIGDFLGDFFIRKAIWSTESAIKENIASFKKFYTFLVEKGKIPEDELFKMKYIIKLDKERWLESAYDFNHNLEDW